MAVLQAFFVIRDKNGYNAGLIISTEVYILKKKTQASGIYNCQIRKGRQMRSRSLCSEKDNIFSGKKIPVIDVEKTGQNIKRIMLSKGMTVKDLQQFLDLGSPQGIYHWFEGKNLPTIDNLYALSDLFHVPMDFLICGNRKYLYMPFSNAMHNRIYYYFEGVKSL